MYQVSCWMLENKSDVESLALRVLWGQAICNKQKKAAGSRAELSVTSTDHGAPRLLGF